MSGSKGPIIDQSRSEMLLKYDEQSGCSVEHVLGGVVEGQWLKIFIKTSEKSCSKVWLLFTAVTRVFLEINGTVSLHELL